VGGWVEVALREREGLRSSVVVGRWLRLLVTLSVSQSVSSGLGRHEGGREVCSYGTGVGGGWWE